MKPDTMYIATISDCISKIEKYTQNGKEDFFNNMIVQDAVIRNFEVIGEAIKSLSSSFKDNNPEISWKNWAGLRDILIHQYDSVNIQILWATIENKIPHLKTIIEKAKTA